MATTSLTISWDSTLDTRILSAYGRRLVLGRNATPAEVKAYILARHIELVKEQEDARDRASIDNAPVTVI